MDELFYLKEQFALLEPNKNGTISLENIKTVGFLLFYHHLITVINLWHPLKLCFLQALMKYSTDAMKESRIHDFLASVYPSGLVPSRSAL